MSNSNTIQTNSFFERLFDAREDDLVAIVNGQPRYSDEFYCEVAELAATLQEIPAERWLLWADSTYQFLVQFFALCFSAKHVVLPGNAQADYLKSILDDFDAVLTNIQLPVDAAGKVIICCGQNSPLRQGERVQLDTAKNTNAPITLYTSGTTGEAKAIFKSVSSFTTETLAQQQMWGARVGAFAVLSTVSHQHIYGFLHYALWPWYRKAPIIDPSSHLSEEVFSLAEQHGPCVLVSSPTHLNRLFTEDAGHFSNQSMFRSIFSSAGLLKKENSATVERCTGTAPVEIFGSTETGGVAWRQQSIGESEDSRWAALRDVVISRDKESGCLFVHSRFTVEENYLMSDRISEIKDGTFSLLGRADRVVKVEGKRLSLDKMLGKLSSHELVDEAKLIVIRGRREEVGAVVKLSESGASALQSLGKRSLNNEFRSYLRNYFEMPLLPRRWRYVNEFPCDAQGKVTQNVLLALFA